MKHHKFIWILAITAAVIAAVVVSMRGQAGLEQPGALSPSDQVLVDEMILALRDDPMAESASAITCVQRVAGIEVLCAEKRLAEGLLAFADDDLDRAQAGFSAAASLRGDWGMPRYALAKLWVRYADRYEGAAEAEFRSAVALEPAWSRPHNGLAVMLRMSGRLDEAMIEALRAIELAPMSVAAHNNYGNLLRVLHDLDGAESAYTKACELDPDHPGPRHNLACVYSLKGMNEDCLQSLSMAIGLNPAYLHAAKTDPDLVGVRKTADFEALINGIGQPES